MITDKTKCGCQHVGNVYCTFCWDDGIDSFMFLEVVAPDGKIRV